MPEKDKNCILPAPEPPKISVIVPVYKVERYLSACLDSLMAQTMKEVEFILVDDGSPDRCGAVCEEYAAKDPRFRVFHTENHGLSAARNFGMEKARGDYLMFADSDDWVSPEFCSAAYDKAAEHDADLVMFDFKRMKGNREVRRQEKPQAPGPKTREEAIGLILGWNSNYAWNKFYKRELFDGVRYPENRVYEDIVTTYKLVYNAEQIWYMDRVLYYYRIREGSITQEKNREGVREIFRARQELLQGLQEHGYPAEKQEFLIKNHYMDYCIKMGRDENDEYAVRAFRWLEEVKGLPRIFTWKQKVLLTAYRISPKLFDLMCVLSGWRLKKE